MEVTKIIDNSPSAINVAQHTLPGLSETIDN